MSQTVEVFRQFMAGLMVTSGGLVEEAGAAGLNYLISPELAAKLDVSSEGCLGFDEEAPPGAFPVRLEPGWLNRLENALEDRGKYLLLALPELYDPPAQPELQLERALGLQNAIYRYLGSEKAWSRYLILYFRYSAVSDEKREGLIPMGINLSNGSPLDPLLNNMLPVFRQGDWPGPAPPLKEKTPPPWEPARLQHWLDIGLPPRLRQQVNPFLNGLRRRLDRDLFRVQEYHAALLQESRQRLKKHPEEQMREKSRQEAILREFLAQGEDLRLKYALKIEVEWVQTLELVLPVERLNVMLKRRKGERRFHLDWNPLARRLEPAPCEASFAPEGPRMMCDERLHLVCPPALAACSQCGKPFCRACFPRACPKCQAPANLSSLVDAGT